MEKYKQDFTSRTREATPEESRNMPILVFFRPKGHKGPLVISRNKEELAKLSRENPPAELQK